MLGSLSSKLRETIDKITKMGVIDKAAVDELVRDIQRALISSDVNVGLVFQISENIKKKALGDIPSGLTRKEFVVKIVYEELTRVMGDEKGHVSLKPKKILLAGLFGSGKTTTSAKLARFYQKKGLKPYLICCDTVRPAAYEQLEQLSKKIDVPFYGEKGKESRTVLKNALKTAAPYDVIIVDTSGRNALDKELVDEIKSLSEILKPDEKILVLPADIGQSAKEQVEAFHNALQITDIIISKLDATAKGGGALTACYQTGAKVVFVTTGEKPDDFDFYDPEKFVARLLGMPDLETLLEKARSVMDEEKAEKIIKGDFDLEDFISQVEGMQKMGPLGQMLEMTGLGRMGSKVNVKEYENKMKKWKYMMQSMTKEEKANPDIINSSRIRRISKGSGCNEHEVRELIASYSKSKKMVKKLSPGKLKRSGLAGMFRQFGMK